MIEERFVKLESKESLIDSLEKLYKFLNYKNRNFCKKYLNQIIEKIKNKKISVS